MIWWTVATFNSNELTTALEYGNVAHYGVPSFWGDDKYLAVVGTGDPVSTYRLPLSDWKPSGAAIEPLNGYTALMPVMHRAGDYSVANGSELTVNNARVTLGEGGNPGGGAMAPTELAWLSLAMLALALRRRNTDQ